MITSAAQWGYVAAAYAVTATVVGGLIAWVVWQARARAAALARLEERGARRRSAPERS
jgi:heme exporter protein D